MSMRETMDSSWGKNCSGCYLNRSLINAVRQTDKGKKHLRHREQHMPKPIEVKLLAVFRELNF